MEIELPYLRSVLIRIANPILGEHDESKKEKIDQCSDGYGQKNFTLRFTFYARMTEEKLMTYFESIFLFSYCFLNTYNYIP